MLLLGAIHDALCALTRPYDLRGLAALFLRNAEAQREWDLDLAARSEAMAAHLIAEAASG